MDNARWELRRGARAERADCVPRLSAYRVIFRKSKPGLSRLAARSIFAGGPRTQSLLVSVLGLSERHGYKRDGHDGSRGTNRRFEWQADERHPFRRSRAL